jgi:hypothetical protein
MLVMAISYVDGVRGRVEQEANERTFRAIRANVKNREGFGVISRRSRRSGPPFIP